MDPRLLRYYNQELVHLHEMGAEFAQQFPKIAARLGMQGIEVSDPYVERLLEGAGFLAARVQLKLDAEFPRFTARLQQIVYPNYLAPTPSMLVARLQPRYDDPNLARGLCIPRGSAMQSQRIKGDGAVCRFRTAHDVTLWPLELTAASYFSYAPDLPLDTLGLAKPIAGGVRLRLRAQGGLNFAQLPLDQLRLFLSGSDELAYRLHELCLGAPLGLLVLPAPGSAATAPTAPAAATAPAGSTVGKRGWHVWLDADHIAPVGYGDEQALLPVALRSFQGYRLLQEYFAFPQRFLFVDLLGLEAALRRHAGNEIELVLLFERADPALEGLVDAANFSLFCTPAVNLFPKRADRIHLRDDCADYHVVADRSRPLDFEIYDLLKVIGHGVGSGSEQLFTPLYGAFGGGAAGAMADSMADSMASAARHGAYYSLEREPRLLSETAQRRGFRSSYVGTEVFLSLVDPADAPYRGDLRQLSIEALCSNRDLALHLPLGLGSTDFTLDEAAPLTAIRCIKGPSRPHAPLGEGAIAWRFISQLSLNYLSLLDTDPRQGAAALRQMLGLYAAAAEPAMKRQIDALLSVATAPSVRRLRGAGPLCYGRGVRIELDVDELGFQGGSAFLFGSVLEQFFTRHVSLNSFTETLLRSRTRGVIKHWEPRCGRRPIL